MGSPIGLLLALTHSVTRHTLLNKPELFYGESSTFVDYGEPAIGDFTNARSVETFVESETIDPTITDSTGGLNSPHRVVSEYIMEDDEALMEDGGTLGGNTLSWDSAMGLGDAINETAVTDVVMQPVDIAGAYSDEAQQDVASETKASDTGEREIGDVSLDEDKPELDVT
jgi:hypothetical protein